MLSRPFNQDRALGSVFRSGDTVGRNRRLSPDGGSTRSVSHSGRLSERSPMDQGVRLGVRSCASRSPMASCANSTSPTHCLACSQRSTMMAFRRKSRSMRLLARSRGRTASTSTPTSCTATMHQRRSFSRMSCASTGCSRRAESAQFDRARRASVVGFADSNCSVIPSHLTVLNRTFWSTVIVQRADRPNRRPTLHEMSVSLAPLCPCDRNGCALGLTRAAVRRLVSSASITVG